MIIRSAKLTPGELVPPIDARLESGQHLRLDWGGQKVTLIYYFDPGCGWCKRNGPPFRTLADQIAAKVSIYSYTPEIRGLDEFKRQTQHVATVITDDREDLRNILRLHGTPQTLVIGHGRRLLKNWAGAYTGSNRTEIQEYFAVHLPELLGPPGD